MHDLVQFAILGLGAGAVYGLLSQGLVMIYRGSGVLNFSQDAMAMMGAYLYYELHVKHGWPTPLAMLTGVGALALLGCAVYLLVMRPLRHSSTLTKAVATLGVLTILEQGALRP